MKVVPLAQPNLRTLNDEQALAAEDEEPLLVTLAWYIVIGWPGRKTVRLMPNSSKRFRCLSNSQVAPSSFSCHGSSRTLATNQPRGRSFVIAQSPFA